MTLDLQEYLQPAFLLEYESQFELFKQLNQLQSGFDEIKRQIPFKGVSMMSILVLAHAIMTQEENFFSRLKT